MSLALSELLSLVSIFFFSCLAAFNAGYYNKIPSHFVKLFPFNNFLTATIPLIQYAFLIYGIFFVLSFLREVVWSSILETRFVAGDPDNPSRVAKFINYLETDFSFYSLIVTLLQVLLGLVLATILSSFSTMLFIEVIPWALSTALALHFLKRQYELTDDLNRRLTYTWLNLVIFSFIFGGTWLKYELLEPPQSIETPNGCIQRKLITATDSGFLFFNPYVKQFEFKNKDDVRIIYQKLDCT